MPGDLAKANSLRKARSTFACASASSAVVAGVSDMPWWVGGWEVEALGDSLGEDLGELMNFFFFRVAFPFFLVPNIVLIWHPLKKPTVKT